VSAGATGAEVRAGAFLRRHDADAAGQRAALSLETLHLAGAFAGEAGVALGVAAAGDGAACRSLGGVSVEALVADGLFARPKNAR